MKSYRKILLILPLLFSSLLVLAQETNCGNGIDDDGDGFIDCYDGDCTGNSQCLDFYFGNSVLCRDPATERPAFVTKLQWASDDQTAFNSVTPAIGDLDGDGTPEVVSTNRQNNTLTILDGATGVTKYGPLNVGFDIAKTVAIANLDDDECGEIFVRGFSNNNLAMYDCQLNKVWGKTTTVSGSYVNIQSLADFNGDGVVELLHGNEIRNAHTGDVIIQGSGNFKSEVTYGTLAIDILPDAACTNCAGLEIVDGGKIYSVNISTATRTLVREINDILPADGQYAIKYSNRNFNAAAVADYNQDGNIDVVFNGGQYVSGSLKTTAFFWDVTNNNALTFNVPQNHSHATGRINVADIDGDGQLNCTFVSKQRLYALDENMEQLWYKDINEGSSGFTGCTVFDFNDDKAAEIIYRGENFVHIIDGKTANSVKTIKCSSRTYEEYPIVADVDGDGASEICVSCSTDDNTPFDPYSNGRYGQIRVFEADAGESWQPSRPIWNQHGYFNVNINDDLTIPIFQQDPTKIFSSNVCTQGDNRPLNAFLNQAPYLNEDGCPSLVSPDVELVEINTIGNALCPETSFNVTTVIRNSGDIALTGLLPITYYNGSPTEPTSIKLNTFVTTIAGFDIGETMSIVGTVIGQGGDFDLYVSVNDDGSQSPPIDNFNRPIPECKDNNNLTFSAVTALPFEIEHDVLSHNENCDPSKPANGDAKVYYFGTISESVEELWNEDFQDLTVATKTDAGATAWEFTHNPADADPDRIEVSFTGSTNELIFDDTDGEVVWETELIDISSNQSAKISVDLRSSAKVDNGNDYMNLYYVVDGGTEQALTDGLHVGNLGSITATASGIVGNNLKIVARVKNDQEDEFYYLDNVIVNGVTDEQTGEITAGFKFYWFKNNNFLDTLFTGSRYSALPNGTYQVVANSLSNSCASDIEEITINKIEVLPVVGITKTNPLTDCTTPDGELTAFVIEDGVQVTNGYNFKWYLGNDFTTVQSTGSVASFLSDKTYSVVVTNELSGCEAILSATVETSIVNPPIQVDAITHITDCVNFQSGSISASSSGIEDGFYFKWYDGPNIKAVADFEGSGSAGATYSGIEAGYYTVEVIDEVSNCASSLETVEVLDNSDSPTIVVTPTSNKSCTGDGSGTATAEINGGDINDYNFAYYTGSNALPANLIATTSGLSNEVAQLLTAGQYLVTATHKVDNCVGRTYFTIVDDITNPGLPTNPISYINITNVTACGGIGDNDGAIDASTLEPQLPDVDTEEYEAIENGSFEVPDITQPPHNSTTFKIFDQAGADGWSTDNASGNLEYWRDNFGGVNAPEGNQFAEINSDGEGAFYFDVVTKPGIHMRWSFQHRGRNGDDTMQLEIDDPSSTTPIVIGTYTTGKAAWATYSGEYIVPAGQTLTRFAFRAVSTAGSITTGNFIDNVIFEVAQYQYELYAGSNSSGTPINTNTSGIFDGLEAGTYTISIIDNITGCPTEDLQIVVSDADSEPISVKQIKTNDEFCVNGNGTQRITATTNPLIGEPAAGYEFTIFDHTDINGTPYQVAATDADGDYTFTSLEDGAYRILVTNLDNNCFSTTDIQIASSSETPTFTSPIISPNTSCSGKPSGFASVNVFGESKLDFTWSWLDPDGNPIVNKTAVANDSANNLTDYVEGIYQVYAINTTTGCETGWMQVVIPLQESYPDVAATEDTPNTGCDIGNGQLSASVFDGGIYVTSGYTFEWFIGTDDSGTALADGDDAGNGSSVGLSGDGNSVINGLNAPSGNATYTVRATSPSNCSSTSTITLSDNSITPVVTGAISTDNHACDGGTYDGTLTAAISYNGSAITLPNADYSFVWYEGDDDSSAPLAETTHELTDVQDGDYTVYVSNNVTGCISGLQTYTVQPDYEVFDIIIDPTLTPNTNCTGTPNGGLEALIEISGVSQLTSDYTFVWYEGDDISTPISAPATAGGTNNNTASSLEAGEYTVAVTSSITNCTYNTTVTLQDATVTYDITPTVSPSTECTNNNGSIEVDDVDITINGVLTSFNTIADVNNNFTIELLDDALVSLGTINADGSDLVDVGVHYIRLTYGSTGCPSTTVQVEIEDESISPIINISEVTPDQACDGGTPTGSLTASIDETAQGNGAAITDDYTFQWYEGSDMNVTTTPVPDANGGNTATISNVAGGAYFVIVTDGADDYLGCTARQGFTLSEDNPVYTITAGTETPVTKCTVQNDGAYTVTTISGTPAAVAADFTYQFFDNGGTEILVGITDETITGLTPGDYSVVATHTVTKCITVSAPFTIDDDSSAPDLSMTVTNNNTTCDGGSPNGILTVTPDPIDAGGPDYSYTWYDGDDVSDTSSPLGQTTAVATGLAAGDYWVLVTDISGDNETCFSKITGEIINTPENVSIVDYTTVATNQCDPENGSITITEITIGGSSTTTDDDMIPYTFNLYESDGTTLIPGAFAQATATTLPIAENLDAATYFAAFENGLSCESGLVEITIGTNTTAPAAVIAQVSPDETCDGADEPTGSLSVDAGVIGNIDVNNFNYKWYAGNDLTTELVDGDGNANGANIPVGETTAATITGLSYGEYTVVVTDNDAANKGCTTQVSFTLLQDAPTYTIDSDVTVDVSNCTDANSGTFEVTTVDKDGTIEAITNYSFEFYDNNGDQLVDGVDGIVIAGTDGPKVENLEVGDYTVVITNAIDKCSSASLPFAIDNTSAIPTLSMATANNTSCDIAVPNGQLTVTPTPADGGSDYAYTWHEGTDLTDTSADPVVGTDNPILSGVDEGDYWVEVTDDNGESITCSAKIGGSIIDNPVDITIALNDITVDNVTDCDPDNGTITIDQLTNDGALVDTEAGLDAYDFTLYLSDGTTIHPTITFDNNSAADFPSASGLTNGTYFVSANENSGTDCNTPLLEVVIDDVATLPVITTAQVNANTNCTGAENGSASVTITATDGAETVVWYEGSDMNDTSNPLAAANFSDDSDTRTIEDLPAGFYWVSVTDNSTDGTGCEAKATVQITDNIPVLTIEVANIKIDNDDTSCSADNGQVTVGQINVVSGAGSTDVADYNFTWFDNNDIELAGAITANTRDDLAPGNYYVVATGITSNCITASGAFTIDDDRSFPTLTAPSTTSTSCDIDNFPNGSLTVTPVPADGGGDYSYQWYEGTIVSPGAMIANADGGNAATVVEQKPGNYHVVVTKTDGTGCSSTIQTSIVQDTDVSPTLVLNNTKEVDECNPNNGEVEATVGTGNADDYNFYWFDDETGTNPITPSTTDAAAIQTADGLDVGFYSVYIENKITGCTSDLETIEVIRDPASEVTIVIFETQPGDCSGPTGELRIEATAPAGTNFVFELFEGEGDLDDPVTGLVGTSSVLAVGNGVDDSDLSTDWVIGSLINNTYTVVATNQTTGCTTRAKHVLFWADVQRVDVDPIVKNHALNCMPYLDGSGNGGQGGNTGTADIVLRIPGGNAGTQDQYQVFLYQGNTALPSPDMQTGSGNWSIADGRDRGIQAKEAILTGQSIDGGTGDKTNTYTFNGLTAGTYAVIAAQEGVSFCYSPPITFEILDETDDIVASAVTVDDNVNCAATPTGSITITEMTRGADTDVEADLTSEYDFAWFNDDTNTPITPKAGNSNSLKGLEEGSYRVEVTKKQGGDNDEEACTETFYYDIFNELPSHFIVDATGQDVTDCDTQDNGTITINNIDIGGVTVPFLTDTANYDFRLYNSLNVLVNNQTGDGDIAKVSDLPAGIYQLVLYNETTECESAPYEVEIINDHHYPTFTESLTNNAGCFGSKTGEIEIDFGVAATNYDVVWYEGELPSGATVTSNEAGFTSTISGLAGGTYTVSVIDNTNPDSGCAAIGTFTITDILDEITAVNLTPTPASTCNDPDNGSVIIDDITLSLSGVITDADAAMDDDYDFILYDENFVEKSTSLVNEFTSLNPGDYFIVVEDATAGCQSAPVAFTITDISETPQLSFSNVDDNTNCDPSLYNGTATVDAVDGSGAYTYVWYRGNLNDTSDPLAGEGLPIAGIGTATISGLKEGSYWVAVTDAAVDPAAHAGCASVAEVTINFDPAIVSISVLPAAITTTDAVDCDAPNRTGTLTVNDILLDGVTDAANLGDYAFSYFDNASVQLVDGVAGITIDATTTMVTGLAPGDYTVVAELTTTGCVSAAAEITIGTTTDSPNITLTPTVNTSCDGGAYDGTVTLNITDLGTRNAPADYTINWYDGVGTDNFRSTGTMSITGLEAGFYTVVVEADVTPGVGCVATATVEVLDDIETFEITNITPTDLVDCEDIGAALVGGMNIDGIGTTAFADIMNYNFTLYDENVANPIAFTNPGTAGSYPSTDTNLGIGTYFVTASDQAGLNCESAPVQFDIIDISVKPEIVITQAAANTTCDPALGTDDYNGELTVDIINDDGGTYTYKWYRGALGDTGDQLSDDPAPVGGQGTATVTGLLEGEYWVHVEDTQSNGRLCDATAAFELQSDYSMITFDFASIDIEDAFDCTTPVGSIEVTDMLLDGVSDLANIGDYSFEYFNSANASQSVANPYINVTPGDYFIVATNTVTGCQSASVQVTVDEIPSTPTISFTPIADNTSCGTPNGSIQVVAAGATTYSYQWYVGGQTSTTTVPNANGGNTATITNVADGEYSVEVTVLTATQEGIGCSVMGTSTIDLDLPTIAIQRATPTASDNCNPAYNGSILVDQLNVDGAFITDEATIATYTFELFDENFVLQDAFDNAGSAAVGDFPSTGDLVSGDYYVVASNTLTCESAAKLVTVDDISSYPDLDFVEISSNSSCNDANPTGSLSVEVAAGTIGDYTIQWYVGDVSNVGVASSEVPAGNVSIVGNTSVISGMTDGEYTVSIIDTTTPGANCKTIASSVISADPLEIVVTLVNQTINTQCTAPYNGSILGQTVSVNGVPLDAPTTAASYTFTYFDENLDALADEAALNEGTYYVVATHTTEGCKSDPFQVNVVDDTDNLTLAFSSPIDNTLCTGYNGGVTATVQYNGVDIDGRFTIEWFQGGVLDVNPVPGGNIASGATDNISIISGLAPGKYAYRATDNADVTSTGCSIIGYHEIEETLVIPTLAIPATDITALTHCTVDNGSITLTDADITDDLVDYNFVWYQQQADLSLLDLGLPVNTTSQTTLANGTYFIEAQHQTTFCETSLVRAVIGDERQDPTVILDEMISDVGCDANSLSLGELNVSISYSEIDGVTKTDPAGGYNFTWTELDGNTLVSGPGTSGADAEDLKNETGGVTYRIDVEDGTTACTTSLTATIAKRSELPLLDISTTDQTTCNNDGEIVVDQIEFNGAIEPLANFTFDWGTTEGGNDLGDDLDGATGGETLSNIGDGIYFITATHKTAGCSSNDTRVLIEDKSVAPTLVFTLDQADQYCTGGNGQLTVTTDAAAPTISWAHGPATATITDLDAIEYTVTITDAATGCFVTDSYVVPFEEEEIMINVQSDVTVIPTTLCGALVNGSIQIDAISPDALADYTFILHTGSYTAGAGVDMGANNGLFENLGADTYYIEAVNTISDCTSGVFEIEVEDESIAPIVDLIDFTIQTNCDLTNPNGLLSVGVDEGGVYNTSTVDYTFDWSANGGPANDPTYLDVAQGFYDITVTNNTTTCLTTETYGMVDSPNNPLLLNVSTTGNENCMDANGELVIQVLNSVNDTPIFEYYLYEGNVPGASGDAANLLNSNFSQDLMEGTYTVLVIDDDSKCSSEPTIVEIENLMNTEDMIMAINQDHALTKCDLDMADGQATVMSVPEDPSRYTFYWHEGTTINDALIDSTLTVYELIDQTYTVHMVDRYTGCETIDQITITNETVPVPLPLTELISDNINCVTPNGAVSAEVNETIVGYTFAWSDDQLNVLSTTSTATGLDEGIYSVKATDINTGCISDAAEIEVETTHDYPVFEVEVTESSCTELISEFSGEYVGTGTADLIFENNTFATEYFWTLDNGAEIDTTNYEVIFSQNERLSGVSPGEYRVLIVDENQCTHEETFTVTTEVVIYNAVSDNGDSKNDYFRITCADKFPNNSVKIYNRSGTLVYETRNYEDKTGGNVFKGSGNTGLGGGGSLPEGTYFYIFDKGAGSNDDVVQGYLELIR